MSNLILTCMQDKDNRTCGVVRCSLKRCVGCKWSRVGKNVEANSKPKMKPLNMYPHYIKCVKCKLTYEATRPDARDSICPECGHSLMKGVNHGNETKRSLQKSRG